MSSEDTTAALLDEITQQAYLEHDAATGDGVQVSDAVRAAFEAGLDRAADVVENWLAGRVVVDLPEPNYAPDMDNAWSAAGNHVVASLDVERPGVEFVDGWMEADDAEAYALAVLAAVRKAREMAAADAAERLSVPGEVRNGQ